MRPEHIFVTWPSIFVAAKSEYEQLPFHKGSTEESSMKRLTEAEDWGVHERTAQ